MREWSQAETYEIGLLLHSEGCTYTTSIELRLNYDDQDYWLSEDQYVDDEGTPQELLSREQYENLDVVLTYINLLQDQWGPDAEGYFDIITKNRSDYGFSCPTIPLNSYQLN